MTFGQKVSVLRKEKKMSQEGLGHAIGTSNHVIGKYERDEIKPSIEVAAKIADALGSSLDYLVRDIKTDRDQPKNEPISQQVTSLLNKFEKLAPIDKDYVIAVVDAFLAKAKLQSIIEQSKQL